MQDTETQLRMKDDEISLLNKTLHSNLFSGASKTNQTVVEAQQAQDRALLMSAMHDTATFLQSLATSYKSAEEEDCSANCFNLPKVITNTGNKSFQNILEHEAIKMIHKKRFDRAAAVMDNETKGIPVTRIFCNELYNYDGRMGVDGVKSCFAQ